VKFIVAGTWKKGDVTAPFIEEITAETKYQALETVKQRIRANGAVIIASSVREMRLRHGDS